MRGKDISGGYLRSSVRSINTGVGRICTSTSYDKDKEGELVINEKEAELVRRIYEEYLEGKSYQAIATGLMKDKIKTVTGGERWWDSSITIILTNGKYYGALLQQKTVIVEFLSHKRVKNKGQEKRVQREWEVNNFFANDKINAPNDVFLYVNDQGNVVPFSQKERNLISEWQKGEKAPIQGIEGHHMELVKDNPDNINLAADPDNILMATKQGHRDFLHGGNTQNPTA
ncbi:recombinase family protein [Paenibacillus agricola]|uniref:recombinase family protein n=1 Tax=Paenibacillus agricola TaxID=2716264 RepID=UPI002892F912|nr:recombinase family protein [Paenibacillus agricola]